MVEVVNSVLGGAFAGLLVVAFGPFPLLAALGAGGMVSAVSLALHHRASLAAWDRADRAVPPRFSSRSAASRRDGGTR